MSESPLAMAECHVREGEVRILRQEQLVAELERDGHTDLAENGRRLLATLQDIQRLGREHVERERAKLGFQGHRPTLA